MDSMPTVCVKLCMFFISKTIVLRVIFLIMYGNFSVAQQTVKKKLSKSNLSYASYTWFFVKIH